MRKIAANYILLPGFEFVKNGYIVLKDGMVVDVVNTGERSGKFLVSNSMGGCLLTIVYDSISCGLPVIRFVRKSFNYIGKIRHTGMVSPLFKGLIFPISFGLRNPGSYTCAKLNTKINEK